MRSCGVKSAELFPLLPLPLPISVGVTMCGIIKRALFLLVASFEWDHPFREDKCVANVLYPPPLVFLSIYLFYRAIESYCTGCLLESSPFPPS